MRAQPPTLSIVVPCFNEQEVLPATGPRLRQLLENLIAAGKASPHSRVVFVDDGSSDNTWDVIEEFCRESNLYSGIALSRNFGHQSAVLAGITTAGGDAVVSIDADLQDDESSIEEMLDFYAKGCDVVYGVRRQRDADTLFKRLTASFFYRLMNALGAETVYNHADFRLLSRRAVMALANFRESSLFLRGIIPLLGFRRASVFYDRRARHAGETKYSLRKMLALTFSAITAFSNLPLRLISLVAGISTVGVVGVICWVLWVRIFTTYGVPGWASSVLPILFVGAVNLLATAIVGEYLARVFSEVKARPRFLVAETRNLGRLG